MSAVLPADGQSRFRPQDRETTLVNASSLLGESGRTECRDCDLGFSKALQMAGKGEIVLDSGWLAARSTEVQFTGTQLTTTHPPSGPTMPWMEAVVPGT